MTREERADIARLLDGTPSTEETATRAVNLLIRILDA
jgi:hypothetical protein